MKDELNFIYNRRQGAILIEAVEHYIHTLRGLKRNVIRDIGDLEDILDKLGD